MSLSLPNLCLIYRHPSPGFFSIEKGFSLLESELARHLSISRLVLPESRLTPFTLCKNLLAIRHPKADVYHVTGHAHYAVLPLPRSQSLLTIHDCGFLNLGSKPRKAILKKLLLDWPVRHSRLITTVSEYSRQDILRHTGCGPDKVISLPLPVSASVAVRSKPFNQTQPVLLFIGSKANKNLPRVIEAVRDLPCLLDVVGIIPSDLESRLRDWNIACRQSHNLSERELSEHYAGADMVLFPSLFEGLGLPIIEAQAAGRPVITSNRSPMKEVAGGAACLVDPLSVASIRDGIVRLSKDEEFRHSLVKKGFQNARNYQPAHIAAQYLAIYQSLLSPHAAAI